MGSRRGYYLNSWEKPNLICFSTTCGILTVKWRGKISPTRAEREWFLYFRKKAFQQFPFQELPYRSRFARQSLLFGHLQRNNSLKQIFFDQVKAHIEDILELSFSLLARFIVQKQQFIMEASFRNIAKNYPEGTIKAFLHELSKDSNSIRTYLQDMRREHTPVVQYELSEMSPLKRFPLLREQERYYCYSPMLLFRLLEHYIYDTLRHYSAQAFGNEFGKTIFSNMSGKLFLILAFLLFVKKIC